MFSNHTFYLENFQWNANDNHKHDYIITGKPWRHRVPWIRFAENIIAGPNNINIGHGAGDASQPHENLGFYEMLKECKWGLILNGRGCGAKNRREVEFSSLGMPLALNYVPKYPFDFVPNKDFVLLKSPEDLLSLKDIDPEPFAERSKYIYSQFFSPSYGVYNSFQIVYNMAKEIYQINKSICYSSIDGSDAVEILPHKGYNIGPLNIGDKISIQYKYGAWKSWGRKQKRGRVSPDNTNGRGGNMGRLGIFSKDGINKILIEVVPEHTNKTPYIFTANIDNLNLCLDICEQNNHSSGSVFYVIKIIKKENTINTV